jgi:catechol 2,3-dioxygenase-like lactoylglutathione lyase family enzyme
VITKIHSASVTVSDQQKAVDWYVNVLGWEVRIDQAVGPDYRFVTVAPVGGEAQLALEATGVMNRQPGDYSGISLSVEDIDGTFTTLAGRGVEFIDESGNPVDGPQTMPWGDRAAWLKDPDGNTFFFIGAQ